MAELEFVCIPNPSFDDYADDLVMLYKEFIETYPAFCGWKLLPQYQEAFTEYVKRTINTSSRLFLAVDHQTQKSVAFLRCKEGGDPQLLNPADYDPKLTGLPANLMDYIVRDYQFCVEIHQQANLAVLGSEKMILFETICVLKEYRNQKVGSRLMQFALHKSRELGYGYACTRAINHYTGKLAERLGFKCMREKGFEGNMPYYNNFIDKHIHQTGKVFLKRLN